MAGGKGVISIENIRLLPLFPALPHFADIVIGQHIILHFLAPALEDQEQGHGQQKKPDHPETYVFVPVYRVGFHDGKPIGNAPQAGQDDQKDQVSGSFPHVRAQNESTFACRP